MRLIINADDLGSSPHTNEAILALMAERVITSATILANAPYVEEAVSQIPRFPWCSFGVHLNLTQYDPLTREASLRPLMDHHHLFDLAAFKRARLNRAAKQAIFAEWSAQIQRLQSLGVRLSHLDSHHDVHTDPRLFLTLIKLQRRWGIKKVRLAKNIYPLPGMAPVRNLGWNLAWRYLTGSRTTDGFTEFGTFVEAARHRLLPYKTVELMVHPGHPHFAVETALLQSAWQGALPLPVNLISYQEL
jgi:predicted glycoside hydrolase/deacetylase ChbG (UPF0249 family)